MAVNGDRYDANLVRQTKTPIYWSGESVEIKRCLWFYKENNEQRFKPYDDVYTEYLEKNYEMTIKNNLFHKKIEWNETEAFVFHSTSIMLHFVEAEMLDEFGNINSDAQRPRIMKRGITEVVDKIEPDEIDQIDHLCFVVHGIGEGCDMKFRPIVDCVDDMRDISMFIEQSHFKSSLEANKIGRIEYLPISWHDELHGDPSGIDKRLKPITLDWTPKLRKFANTTILDVLFYTSPIYCQTIISKVGNELNNLYKLFCSRNPKFKGRVSLIGHSLGSLIVFDILSNQQQYDHQNQALNNEPIKDIDKFLTDLGLGIYIDTFKKEKIDPQNMLLLNDNDLSSMGLPLGPRKTLLNAISAHISLMDRNHLNDRIKENLEAERQRNAAENLARKKSVDYYEYGLAGTGQLFVKYPKLDFHVDNFFALGSPIAMFLTVRGIDKLSVDYSFPTCESFFNIFHPFDPVAYRLEPLILPNIDVEPVLMDHHLGRKRMHLEIKEGLAKVSADVKQLMMQKFKTTWSSITDFAKAHKLSSQAAVTPDEEGIQNAQEELEQLENKIDQLKVAEATISENEITPQNELNIKIGMLNQGRRIDYVLQERPIESFNEYLFAFASHACYWESEDTMLLIVKEILSKLSIKADPVQQLTGYAAIEQQSLSIAQAAASTFSQTFSYLTSSLPQQLTNALTTTPKKPIKEV